MRMSRRLALFALLALTSIKPRSRLTSFQSSRLISESLRPANAATVSIGTTSGDVDCAEFSKAVSSLIEKISGCFINQFRSTGTFDRIRIDHSTALGVAEKHANICSEVRAGFRGALKIS